MRRALQEQDHPGIGSRKLSTIRPEERTTPAGRFVADLGHDFGQDILWIDYTTSISLHRVIRGTPGDHRLQRLATTSPLDKRISYGCINVPVKFFDNVVLETFSGTRGIVYILPEVKTIQEVFSISGVPSATARARVAEAAGIAARAAPGAGSGYVSVFNPDGSLAGRLISQGLLNAPWGFAMAPASRALTLIADRLFKSAPPPMVDGGMKLMWHRLFREASVSR